MGVRPYSAGFARRMFACFDVIRLPFDRFAEALAALSRSRGEGTTARVDPYQKSALTTLFVSS
ncbi:MAG: hypothetical protein C3F11_01350 [Methylocystaceae bacterium]|nr:MAG: hypothetical protein C3F11_01350 [Methylocystaceae bacterium]